jgi:hypothetical protein
VPLQGYAYVAIGLAASSFLTFPVAVALLKPRPPKAAKTPKQASLPSKPSETPSLREVVISDKSSQSEVDLGHDKETAYCKPAVSRPPPSAFESVGRRRAALTSSVSAPVGPTALRRGTTLTETLDSLPFQGRKAADAVGWPADGPAEAHAFERLTSLAAREAMLSVCLPEEDENEDATKGSSEKLHEVELAKIDPASASPDSKQTRRGQMMERLK